MIERRGDHEEEKLQHHHDRATITSSLTNLVDPMNIPDTGCVVSGISGRLPGADSVDEFKQKLTDNCDMCLDHDDVRWPYRTADLPPRAGRVKNIDHFDGEFFGYANERVKFIEHQLRFLYEVIYESIFDAGVNPASIRGTKTGLMMGLHMNEYEETMENEYEYESRGRGSQLTDFVADYFDIKGPVCIFDSACASGFSALHEAVTMMQHENIDQIIVCSVNISIRPSSCLGFVKMQMVSPTGYSRFGDANADGYVRSEACVSIFLQKKGVTLRNYATFLVTKMNSDGYKKEGVTFPSTSGQETLIREAKQSLESFHSDHVEVIEAHGTGTPAGDPIECEALSRVYCPKDSTNERTIGPLLLGSSKTYMGHSEGASGLCALVKVILMFENEIIYKSLHFEKPNPNIESLMDGRIEIVQENRPLKSKIIPISCYGFGGANVHVIVRSNDGPIVSDSTEAISESISEKYRLILMFGRNQQSLETFFSTITSEENKHRALTRDFCSLTDSLCKGTIDRLMSYRGYSIVDLNSKQQLLKSVRKCQLLPLSNSDPHAKDHFQNSQSRLCYFVYPGLGSQWPGMATSLKQCTVFWSTIERLNDILKQVGYSLIESLEGRKQVQQQNITTIADNDGEISIIDAFVGITAIQIALTNILGQNLNVNPSGGMLGHSIGEIACAYSAGIFNEQEAILLAYCLSSTLVKNYDKIRGSMVAISMNLDEMQVIIDNFNDKQKQKQSTIYISCNNGPKSVTISGIKDDIREFLQHIERIDANIVCTDLNIGYALHNPYVMKDMLFQFVSDCNELLPSLGDLTRDEIRWFSSVHYSSKEEMMKLSKAANAEYYANNLCKRVDFYQAINKIQRNNSIVIEIAPHGIFESIFRTIMPSNDSHLSYIKLMKKNDLNGTLTLFASIGDLFQSGIKVDLSSSGLYPKMKFPIRKQVPSLSSLLTWNHSESHYVPKYPQQFSHTSEVLKITVDILSEDEKYLSGHVNDGRTLLPATGYLYYAWNVFSSYERGIFDLQFSSKQVDLLPIEFHKVRLHRAIILKSNAPSEMKLIYEPHTGYFEITEGGQVVVDGYMKSPDINPNGLLYEDVARRMKNEKLELSLDHNDIYKQFRVHGYDYGETFRCIQSSSADGRHAKINFNGFIVSLLDNVLQSLFLTISSKAAHNILFLPTGFDYVRLNPEILTERVLLSGYKTLNKSRVHKPRAAEDLGLTEGSRNLLKTQDTEGSVEPKNDIQEQNQPDEESNSAEIHDTSTDTSSLDEKNGKKPAIYQKEKEEEQPKECIFDTYCDPLLGIVITDGVEMRGVKATPVMRRETAKPLLECYKFIVDIEEPVQDLQLSENLSREQYKTVCDSVVSKILVDSLIINQVQKSNNPNASVSQELAKSQQKDTEIDAKDYLSIRYKDLNSSAADIDEKSEKFVSSNMQKISHKELAKNKPFFMLSLLDSLSYKVSCNINAKVEMSRNSSERRFEILNESFISSLMEHEEYLNEDFMVSSFSNDRFIKPMLEAIVENRCQSKNKLTLLEIINSDISHYNQLDKQLAGDVASQVNLKYIVAHPNPSKLDTPGDGSLTLHTLRDIEHASKSSLLSLIKADNPINAVYFYDSLCSIGKAGIENFERFGPILDNLKEVIETKGFLLIVTRYKFSYAERFIIALNQMKATATPSADDILNRMEAIQSTCEERIHDLEDAAKRCQFDLVSKKMDTTGCALFLFNNASSKSDGPQKSSLADKNTHKIIHVKHSDYSGWFNELKEELKQVEVKNNDKSSDKTKEETMENSSNSTSRKKIWLCAAATKDKPINGIVGMIQCLKRELGNTENLRCFFDLHTFQKRQEREISLEDIEMSENFRLAFKKDLFWNCINSQGQWGSFRHLSLSNYFDDDGKSNIVPNGQSHLIETQRAYANVSRLGDLSSFRWYEAPIDFTGSNERTRSIKIKYSALNFRDVMFATGKLPLDAIPLEIAMDDCLIGLEFSGIDLTHKKRVAGMIINRSLATQLSLTHNNFYIYDIPDTMSLKDAVTMPVVYLTAIMALICRGKMQAGESILIHAGSGGVGQAAIRLALHHNLKVFTTVGTEEKRQFLLQEFQQAGLSSNQIFNSRNCSFEHHIMEATLGRGVDLVLNSLADDKLQASVRCLATNGRFLEIGKYDQAVNAKLELAKLDINKTFHSVHLDMMFNRKTVTPFFEEQIMRSTKILAEGIKTGYIKPIKHHCFSKEQVEEAFRFMATGKHIGKVLIEIEPELKDIRDDLKLTNIVRAVPRFQLDPRLSYIVTGGLGGFGLELIKWLASVGGRYFVVTSRTGVRTGYQRVVLSRLERSFECKFVIADQSMANGTTRDGIEKVFKLAAEHSPVGKIGGVFHLAVVLKDNLLENMTSEDFDEVCKPKADACIFLDEVSRSVAPDMPFFVAFSSVSSGKGNGGQINYGYANSVMERICEQRREDNLHGLAIQWGPIGDVGIAYETLSGNESVINGTLPQRMPSCFSTLAKLMCVPFAVCSSIVQVNDDSIMSVKRKGDLVATVLHVLGVQDASKIDDKTTLGELGLDSLMAVEIRQYIEREYELTLTTQEIRALTIARIREIDEADKNKEKMSDNKESIGDIANTKMIAEKINSLRQSGFSMSSGMDVGFKPARELPKVDCFRLNQVPITDEVSPVFVLTHIHGSFERLEMICNKVNRPCVGLNYTSQLNAMESFKEIAQYFLEYLDKLNWTSLQIEKKSTGKSQQKQKVVDLIGYSFGAVISYELLVLIQDRIKRGHSSLLSGHYILLDMSPKLAEIMGRMSGSLLESKADEMLIGYISHHVTDIDTSFDYTEMKKKMDSVQTGLDGKFKLVTETLSNMLNITDQTKQEDLYDAIVAFYKRYKILFSYKSHKSYVGDATLIRAEEDLIANADGVKTAEDYYLSEVIDGRIALHKFAGNHESCIINNVTDISAIINKIVSIS